VKRVPKSEVSAQIVLVSSSGKRMDRNVPITSANIRDYLPAADSAAAAAAFFQSAGFHIGPTVGNNFSITAPAALFESIFGAILRHNSDGTISSMAGDGSSAFELPLSSLPPSVAKLLEYATFTSPAELH
jgi:hypothetical protein